MNNNSFGTKLKNYRKAMQLTQTDLGKMLNVSQVTIAHYERGERFPKHDMLLAISSIFNVSLDSLLENNKPEIDVISYPEDFKFDIDTLIQILLNSPLKHAFNYTRGWKASGGLDLIDFYEQVITTALVRIGELWFKGEILVSEEHLITDKIRELILLHSNFEIERKDVSSSYKKKWMGFCAPGEAHELALLMNAQSLRLKGWDIFYLGVHVPFKDLSGIIKKYQPDVLGISITMSLNIEGLDMYIRQLRAEFGGSPAIILGGQGLTPDSLKGISGINGIAVSINEGIVLAEKSMNITKSYKKVD